MNHSFFCWRGVVLATATALSTWACGGTAGSAPTDTGGASGAPGGSGGSIASGGSAGTPSGGTSSADSAGAPPACPGSPSGYECDPWSVFLYPSDGTIRNGDAIRFQVHHDVDLEGNPNDETIAPGHDFAQILSVDIALSPEVRSYLCTVFVPASTSLSFDPASPEFVSSVSPSVGSSLLGTLPNDYTPHPQNVVDICGAGPLTAVVTPDLVSMPTLPDIVLVLPLAPKPTDFHVGDSVSLWLARGILWVDEESELSPPVDATIVEEQ